LHHLYDGYKAAFPPLAYKILLISEKIETKLNPKKQKIFDVEKPTARKKADFFYSNERKKRDLIKAIAALDPRWEKAMRVDALYEILTGAFGKEADFYKEQLFLDYPPIFSISPIKMRFNITFDESELNKKERNKISKGLKNRGVLHSKESRFNIDIKKKSDIFYVSIYDNGNIIKSYNIKMDPNAKNFYEKLTIEIFKKVFILEL